VQTHLTNSHMQEQLSLTNNSVKDYIHAIEDFKKQVAKKAQ
jgi:hypothetical protein